jgi:GH15 family glucan-1,4-alpha-glucosidase
MLLFWGFVIVGIFFLDRIRRLEKENKSLEAQYRLYELRDQLREAAMNKEVDPKSWLFEYLDSTLSKTIDNIGALSLINVLIWGILPREDQQVIAAREKLQQELSDPVNGILPRFYTSYIGAIAATLWARHALLRFATKRMIELSYIKSAIEKMRDAWRDILSNQTQNPELSTLRQCY